MAAYKGRQLLAAQAIGLRIPRSKITNDPQAVQAFSKEAIPLVYKRLGTKGDRVVATQPMGVDDFRRLPNLVGCPAIFQEKIGARVDVRVTAIGDSLFSAEIDSQVGASPLDWRFDQSVAFRPHVLDNETARMLRSFLRSLGLDYGAIDLRLTKEGEYVFLEVNPSGQFLFVELLAGMPLSDHMAEFLANGAG